MGLDGFLPISEILGSGVYALGHRGEIVYVGKAKGMLNRIYTHRSMWAAARKRGPAPSWIPVKGILFDEVYIRPCPLDRLDALEQELIAKHRPKYNRQHKPPLAVAEPLAIRVNGISLTLNAHAKPKLERRI